MPRESVFLDTSGWIAVLNASDGLHTQAVAAWHDIRKRAAIVVVTDWIIAETGNGLARSSARPRFSRTVHQLLSSHHARLLYVDEPLLSQALDLYENRNDKSWGLVDCASMIVMEQEGIREVFSSDRHFAQAGFHCLLTPTSTS